MNPYDTPTTHLTLTTEGQPTLNFSSFGTDTASERTTVRLRPRSAGAVRLAEGARLADYPGHLTLYRELPPEPGLPRARPFNAILWEKAAASGASRTRPYYVVQLYVPDAVYDAVSRAGLCATCRLELQLEVPGLASATLSANPSANASAHASAHASACASSTAPGNQAGTNGGPDCFADFYALGSVDIEGYSISITHEPRARTARVKAQPPPSARPPAASATRRTAKRTPAPAAPPEENRPGRRASA